MHNGYKTEVSCSKFLNENRNTDRLSNQVVSNKFSELSEAVTTLVNNL